MVLTLVDAGPSFGWFELEQDLSLALGIARLAVLAFMALRLVRDLKVPVRVVASLGALLLVGTVLGVLFFIPPQTVILEPQDEPYGADLYAQHCADCHGPAGRGASASSLVDGDWAYGRGFDEVSLNIAAGIPEAGMPAFSADMGSESVPFVTAYLFELEAAEQLD